MEPFMNINGELVKMLRIQRSWSQDELAAACGLSLRTVQRIESTGSCSLESKKALASVFEVEARALEVDESAMIKAMANRRGKFYGFAGVLAGLVCAYGAITYSLWTGSMDSGDAGLAYGITGAFCGICAALVGRAARRLEEI